MIQKQLTIISYILPIYNNNPFSYLDATTGKWGSVYGEIEFHQVYTSDC